MDVVIAAFLGAVFGWATNEFLPRVWRGITRRPLIEIFVETDPTIIWAGAPPWISASFVMPSVDGLGAPPTNFCLDWHNWLVRQGGVAGDRLELDVTLTSTTDAVVVVDAVRAKVHKRETPQPWTHLQCAVGGASIGYRHVEIDLDGFDPPTTSFAGDATDSAHIRRLPTRLSVGTGEVEKLHLAGVTQSSYVEWTADLVTIINGKRRLFTIDDHGRPFRTCATHGLPTHTWMSTEWSPPLPA